MLAFRARIFHLNMSLLFRGQHIDLSQNCAESDEFDHRIRATLLQRIKLALNCLWLVFFDGLRNFEQSFSYLTFLIHIHARIRLIIVHQIGFLSHTTWVYQGRILAISDKLIRIDNALMRLNRLHWGWLLYVETSDKVAVKFAHLRRSLQSLFKFLLRNLTLTHIEGRDLLQEASYGLVLQLLKNFLLNLGNLSILVEISADIIVTHLLTLRLSSSILGLDWLIWDRASNFLEQTLQLIVTQNGGN